MNGNDQSLSATPKASAGIIMDLDLEIDQSQGQGQGRGQGSSSNHSQQQYAPQHSQHQSQHTTQSTHPSPHSAYQASSGNTPNISQMLSNSNGDQNGSTLIQALGGAGLEGIEGIEGLLGLSDFDMTMANGMKADSGPVKGDAQETGQAQGGGYDALQAGLLQQQVSVVLLRDHNPRPITQATSRLGG
jgi:hypothetical protein